MIDRISLLCLAVLAGWAAPPSVTTGASISAETRSQFMNWCEAQRDPVDLNADPAPPCVCLANSMGNEGATDLQVRALLFEMTGVTAAGNAKSASDMLVSNGFAPLSAAQQMAQFVPSREQQEMVPHYVLNGPDCSHVFKSCGQPT